MVGLQLVFGQITTLILLLPVHPRAWPGRPEGLPTGVAGLSFREGQDAQGTPPSRVGSRPEAPCGGWGEGGRKRSCERIDPPRKGGAEL